MKNERKVILYIAMSLDGYIADKNDNLDFLSLVEKKGEDYGYAEFVESTDTIIIGRKSFDKVLSMGFEYPHIDKNVYIITNSKRESYKNFSFYNGDLIELVHNLKNNIGKNIYCDGGAIIANELRKNDLIDEYIISVIPVLLGDGIKLFKELNFYQKLELISTKTFEKGLVQLHYKRSK